MPCTLNDWNELILQMLQVSLVCNGTLHKDQSNKPLLVDCTSHGAFFQDGAISPQLYGFS